ncbi:LacI family DNA-binding transcriptional regulator [Streptomyces sp. ID05-04B]|uniref:LacI family DNA-binding transcriptional regulator n=1 Tax=unclassified Streptomyces TaxID=2593676 RepID=UPI000D1A1A4E|nr:MULTISPECIES: LacI family DNA-binding transcriptional regulator [unclassified Streptomyces]AVV44131.1 transcriptional regulator [Streptomyces sp. P3]MDX5570602.1 LacI family DNA-binding transcriptional regulator [Streptomyces sp. ID05-04B]
MATVVGRSEGSPVPRSADVARLAGVSRKTVSRVLNNEPYVSEKARTKVLAAAEELGYRLNQAARTLASGRTGSIGVVALGTAGYGTASLLVHIERAVRDAGYALRVVNTADGDPAGIAGAVESLLEQGVDGVIVSEPIVDGDVSVGVDVPVLFLGAPPAFTATRTVTMGVGAPELARAATEHLLDLGHATVHHLAGPHGWYATKDRIEGWRAALTARGAHEPPLLNGDWSPASGYAAGRELASDSSVTAVFAAGDEMAIGLIHAMREAGRRVPEDVSVVGFDDNPVFAYVSPPLTTVRQPFDAAARQGVGLLVHAIEKPDTELPPASAPPVALVVRCSTAPPPSSKGQSLSHTT